LAARWRGCRAYLADRDFHFVGWYPDHPDQRRRNKENPCRSYRAGRPPTRTRLGGRSGRVPSQTPILRALVGVVCLGWVLNSCLQHLLHLAPVFPNGAIITRTTQTT